VAKVAAGLGQPFMPHQRQVVDVALEVDALSGLPAYREVRLSIPRQNAKTSTLLAVEVDRSLFWGPGQHIVYTAQDRNYARSKWEEQCQFIERTPFGLMMKARRSNGSEQMAWASTGSTIGITAPTKTAGHSTTLDLGVIDEAWARPDADVEQGFRPAMSTRPAAQLWVVSTMGTEESVYLHDKVDDGRARVEAGERSDVAYFEWSAGDDDDPDDPETWWGCMPALGYTVTENVIRVDHDAMDPAEFARAYLNRRAGGGRPVFAVASWQGCRDPGSSFAGVPCFALDVTPDTGPDRWASIGVAGRRSDGRQHVEIIEHRQGTDWVVGRLQELYRRWNPWPVMVDGLSPAYSLVGELERLSVKTDATTAREYAAACAQFYDAVAAAGVRHLDQPVLNAAVGAARKRTLGDTWVWARRAGGDVSPLVAVTLARYGLVKAGDGGFQIL
jgi:hypothetical protein